MFNRTLLDEDEFRSYELKSDETKVSARSLMKGAGLTDEQIRRPFIGICNSYSNFFPGHSNLDKIGQAVKDGVLMGGGTPVEFGTIGICDGMVMGTDGMKYSLPSRELIADSVETMAKAHICDAVVLVCGCDKIIPGMIMGALRLDVPFIVVTAGPMLPGHYNGERVDVQTIAECAGQVIAGTLDSEIYCAYEDEVCPTCGSCQGMFTANSMACMTEVLGIALPGTGTVPAVSAKRYHMAKRSGMIAVELAKYDFRPSSFITKESFLNAIKLDMMLGCSTNTALHLPAMAHELGIKISLEDFDRIGRETPHLVKLSPSGEHLMVDLDNAGGVSAVINQAIKEGVIGGEQETVTGKTLAQNVSSAAVWDAGVIRPFADPYSPEGGLAVLYGNLAPLGAVIKTAGVDPAMFVHSGPAKVFNSHQEALNALIFGDIVPGDVVVLRYEGPKGGPGMQEMLMLTALMCGMGMDKDIALVTDGRFSGLSRGGVIGHVSPEAALGGNIALVENGDTVSYSIPDRSITLEVPEDVLARRRANLAAPERPELKGWLARYAKLVGPVSDGAVLE
ncbi:MAG: dihydroxy-acid dehydratase [Clostridiales bacterium]|nr:dihydroxy-acid dehydratase [Clostridiales bacterium]